ncbi:MAG: hypothetical protein ABI925_11605 [Verrucomicrobiota bacterium]
MERFPNPYERPPGQPERFSVKCPICGGSGKVTEGGQQKTCKRCNGSGEIRTN